MSRNTIKPQRHSFIVQGLDTDAVYLIYRPYFHNANGRFQVVLSVNLVIPADSRLHGKLDGAVVTLTTKENVNVEDICQDGASFAATITDACVNPSLLNLMLLTTWNY